MDEIIFVGIDIEKATKKLLEAIDVCNGMTDSEKTAYDMGVTNALSALRAIVSEEVCVHIPGKEIFEEMDYAELKKIFIEQKVRLE